MSIEKLFQLYDKYGSEDYIGEEVSQIEHMLQAGQLAYKEGYDDEFILACFFHDIGHLLTFENKELEKNFYGSVNHEKDGSKYLKQLGFSEKITTLVGNHVRAKKYLLFKNPEYIDKLSVASRHTLIDQGGIMSAEEAREFEKEPFFELSLKIRKIDDKAKEKNLETLPLDFFKNLAYEYFKLNN